MRSAAARLRRLRSQAAYRSDLRTARRSCVIGKGGRGAHAIPRGERKGPTTVPGGFGRCLAIGVRRRERLGPHPYRSAYLGAVRGSRPAVQCATPALVPWPFPKEPPRGLLEGRVTQGIHVACLIAASRAQTRGAALRAGNGVGAISAEIRGRAAAMRDACRTPGWRQPAYRTAYL